MAKFLGKDLKSSHFSMGKNNEPMSTIAREAYCFRPQPTLLSSQSAPNFRGNNIKMGDDKVVYTSENNNMMTGCMGSQPNKAAGIVMNEDENKRQSHLLLGQTKLG